MAIETDSKKSQTQSNSFGPNGYEKALELAEAGEHEEALTCIQEYLSSASDDTDALNDAGAILHCLGRWDEAIEHLEKARNLRGDSAEIIWNLSETYLAVGKAKQAIELFDEMDRLGILNADVLNRTANVLLNESKPADALEMLRRSQEHSPNQEILQPMIEVIRNKMAEDDSE
ncbi:MAG: tetratricopeptide repeat protein [Planctomycetes bacterium]|nr:tetratricopeptide repeat protein [Planctomycetota bacterium]